MSLELTNMYLKKLRFKKLQLYIIHMHAGVAKYTRSWQFQTKTPLDQPAWIISLELTNNQKKIEI